MEIENKKLKLNYKNTILIGMAFFSITLLWTVYGQYCPKLITKILIDSKLCATENDTLFPVGIIMALDNALALFMLPIFGTLSDKTKCSFGKRMIYIFPGMIISSIIFPFIAVAFLVAPSLYGVWAPLAIVILVILMGLVLIVMNIYRNPAVALMPDVTPKPLRSKANGIINFVGYVGGAIAGILAMFFTIDKGAHYPIFAFVIASVFMIAAAIILVTNIKENKLLEENKKLMLEGEKQSETFSDVEGGEKLSKTDKKNFVIILLGVLFWYFAFNAVETFAPLFCEYILGHENMGGTIVIVLTASSLISFMLLLNLPAKIGRKWTVIVGIGTMIFAFLGIIITMLASGVFSSNYEINDAVKEMWKTRVIIIYVFVAFLGCGWALINANSYPMVVELASGKNIGKYTGLYYTFAMVAQTLTPIISGAWMQYGQSKNGLNLLFIYSLIMSAIALVTMLFFTEKKKVIKKSKIGFEALDND